MDVTQVVCFFIGTTLGRTILGRTILDRTILVRTKMF